MIITIQDVHALGLKRRQQGMYLTDSWYSEPEPRGQHGARRFFDKHQAHAHLFHAGDYSATLQYLRPCRSRARTMATKVMEQLRKTRFNATCSSADGWLRADGLMVHDMHLDAEDA